MANTLSFGMLTEADWPEYVRLTRRWYYWPLRLVGDSHGYAFVYVGIIGLGAAALDPHRYRTRDVLLGSAASLGLGMLLLWLTRATRSWRVRKRISRYNRESCPVVANEKGLVFRKGQKFVKVPWAFYREALIGDRVIVLWPTKGQRGVHILPITEWDPARRQDLINALHMHLGHDKTKEAPSANG